MRRRARLVFLTIGGLCSSWTNGRAAQPDFSVTLTGSDLTVGQTGQAVPAFSAQRWARQELSALLRASGRSAPSCDYRQRVELIALVGSLLSLRETLQADCPPEAHPTEESKLLTFDLAAASRAPSHPLKPLTLTELFPAEKVLTGLLASSTLHALLPTPAPTRLASLLHGLADQSGAGPDDCFVVPPDLLSRFALANFKDAVANVQLGLPGDGPCRTNLTPVTLSLKPSIDLARLLDNAAAGRNGFVSKDRATSPTITVRIQVIHGVVAKGLATADPQETGLQPD